MAAAVGRGSPAGWCTRMARSRAARIACFGELCFDGESESARTEALRVSGNSWAIFLVSVRFEKRRFSLRRKGTGAGCHTGGGRGGRVLQVVPRLVSMLPRELCSGAHELRHSLVCRLAGVGLLRVAAGAGQLPGEELVSPHRRDDRAAARSSRHVLRVGRKFERSTGNSLIGQGTSPRAFIFSLENTICKDPHGHAFL